jgi:hypothetical protein
LKATWATDTKETEFEATPMNSGDSSQIPTKIELTPTTITTDQKTGIASRLDNYFNTITIYAQVTADHQSLTQSGTKRTEVMLKYVSEGPGGFKLQDAITACSPLMSADRRAALALDFGI